MRLPGTAQGSDGGDRPASDRLWDILHIYQGLGAAMTIFCLGLMYATYFYRTRRL